MRTRLVLAAVLAAAVPLAGAALAAPAVSVDSVAVSGGTATVTGTAAFDGAGTGAVGGTPTTAAPNGAAFAPGGVDLKSASITPLPDGKGLRFTWQLTSLPASPPPEVTRYTWSFAVGDKTFQLQAKRSNAGSTTVLDDPQGHLTSAAGGAFQLRGNCTASYMGTPVSSCPHLAFLTGAFDPGKAQVTMDLPYGLAQAKEVVPGAVLTPVETAGMSISAAYQAAVSNTTISTYVNDWTPYATAPTVSLATGLAGDDQSGLTYVPAPLDGSRFSGSVPVEDGADVVVVRACQGTVCTSTEAPLG